MYLFLSGLGSGGLSYVSSNSIDMSEQADFFSHYIDNNPAIIKVGMIFSRVLELFPMSYFFIIAFGVIVLIIRRVARRD